MNIGIDLGGTNIVGGIVNTNGEILFSETLPTNSQRENNLIIDDIVKIIKTLKEKAIKNNIEIEAAGIGVPGPVDTENGIVIKCVNLGWEDINLKEIIEKEVGTQIYIENDASVAGFAELKYGAMKGFNSGVVITLGTGVGGAVIVDNALIKSKNGIASEIGHMVVGENFYNCNCGKNGCLETFSSATALIKYTKKLIEDRETNTSILKKASNDVDRINGKIIIDSAKEGDKLALKAVERLALYLGIGIVNISSVIDPECFLIGGGLSNAGDFLIEKIANEVNVNKFFPEIGIGKIKIAELGSEAGLIGAAAYAEAQN